MHSAVNQLSLPSLSSVPTLSTLSTPSVFSDEGNVYQFAHYVGDMKPEDIYISQKDGMLTIRGSTKKENEHGMVHYSFEQKVPVPRSSNMKSMKSYLQQGNVVVHIPK
jgi:HSP20 family molecular chaperone IbpA